MHPTSIPQLATQYSIPPQVSGTTYSTLKIKCYKIIWNKPPAKKSSSIENIKNPYARICWWGDITNKKIPFYPLNVGISSSATVKKTRTSINFAVKCQKKQLASYFKDMGSLKFEIIMNGEIIGIATVSDLSCLVRETYKPLNAFFPVFEYHQSGLNEKSHLNQKRIAEIHIVIELLEHAISPKNESVTNHLNESMSINLIQDQMIKKISPINEMPQENLEYIPRPPPALRETKNPNTQNISGQKNPSLDPFNSPNVAKVKSTLQSPIIIPEMKSEDQKIVENTQETKKYLDNSSFDFLEGIVNKVTKLKNSMTSSLNQSYSLKAIAGSKKAIADAKNNMDVFEYDDDVKTLKSYSTSDSFDTDLPHFNDDIVIQALNDNYSISDAYIPDELNEIEMPSINYLDDLSDDEARLTILSHIDNWKGNVSKSDIYRRSEDFLTDLGRVHSIYFQISSLKSSFISSNFSYKLQVNIPNDSKNIQTFSKTEKSKKNRLGIKTEEPNQLIEFNYEDACSVRFNKALIDLWEKVKIEFKVSAWNDRVVSSTPEWEAYGKIQCKDLFNTELLEFKGPVSLWKISGEPRLAGSLDVRIQLIDHALEHKSESNFQGKNDIPSLPTTPPDMLMQPKKDQSLVYVYLNLSILRTHHFSHLENASSVLVYLNVRAFSLPRPLETSPIFLNPPFEPVSGKLSSPTDFKFHYLLPFTFSNDLKKSEKSPIIVEVWSIISGESKSSEKGPVLLGLIRLPFQYLLSMIDDSEINKQPVILPDVDYVVSNPFSGKSVGWLAGFLAVGSLSKMNEIKSERQTHKTEVTNEKNYQISCGESLCNIQPKAIKPVDDIVVKPNTLENSGSIKQLSPIEMFPMQSSKSTIEKSVMESANLFKMKSVDVETSAHNPVLSLSIFSACGLKGLLAYAKEINGHSPEYTPIDYALDIGINSRITMTLFSSTDNEENNGSAIETNTVANSFTPNYDYHVDLKLSKFDSDFVKWIRNGGAAHGKIWHRIPLDICSSTETQDILLGEFDLPLESILLNNQGLNKHWVQVFPPKNIQKSNNNIWAAAQVSIKFSDGFDLGEIHEESFQLKNSYDFFADISLIRMKNNINICNGDSVSISWETPESHQSITKFRNNESPSFKWNKNLENTFSRLDDFGGIKITLSPAYLNIYRLRKFGLHFWNNGSSISRKSYIGFAQIDIFKFVQDLKKSSRGKVESPISLDSTLLVINPDSADLCDCSVELNISICKSKSDDISLKNASFSGLHNEPQIPGRLSIISQHITKEKINLYVKIDRAMNLPLIRDYLINDSPFVKSNELQTGPPNCQVSFEWRCENSKDQTFTTNIINNQISPIWQQEFTISIPKDPQILQNLQKNGELVFYLWHINNVSGFGKKSKIQKELIGECIVDLGALFFGIDKIHGWYPVKSSSGADSGQLMVQAFPSESLKDIMAKFSELEAKALENSTVQLESKMSQFTLKHKKNMAIVEPTNNAEADTWVWSGSGWEHKKVASMGKSQIEPKQNRSYLLPLKITLNEASIFSKTMKDMDDLKIKLKNISNSPKPLSPLSNKPEEVQVIDSLLCNEIDTERMDQILRISRSWTPEPSNIPELTKPLTLDELTNEPISVKDEGTQYLSPSLDDTEAPIIIPLESESKPIYLETETPSSFSSFVKNELSNNLNGDKFSDDEIVVYRSINKPKLSYKPSKKEIQYEADNDDVAIFEELARRRIMASKSLNPVIEDAKNLLQERANHPRPPINPQFKKINIEYNLKDDRMINVNNISNRNN